MNPAKSFKDRLLGEEISLPVGELGEPNPIQVYYTYYVGKPESHRLEFQQKGRVKFEIFLPRYSENISRICGMEKDLKNPEGECEIHLGFIIRLLLLFKAGRPVVCRDLFVGPVSELKLQRAEAASAYLYRLVSCVKGEKESIAFISSRRSRQSATFRKGSSEELNWLILSPKSFTELVQALRIFMDSPVFPNIENQI